MIVQRLPGGDEALVVLHEHHLNLAGQLAGAWGNDTVAAPHETVVYMARNHDAGWPTYDREPLLAPDRLPLDMPDMPTLVLTRIHDRSIRRNYLNHPYTGILGCCHTLGFYSGRQGVSDFLVHHMDDATARHPELVPYLKEFERRRDAWAQELRERGELLDQLEPDAVDRNYAALQVFDTMSLYFCAYRGEAGSFPNVLGTDGSALTVRIEPEPGGGGALRVDPWPFGPGELRLVLDRKRVGTADSARGAIEDAPTEQVAYTLRPR